MLSTLFVALLSQTPGPTAAPGVVVLVSQQTVVTPERSLHLAQEVSDALKANGVPVTIAPAAAQQELSPVMKDTTACDGNRRCLAKLATVVRARAAITLDVAEVMKETALHLEMISEDGTRVAEHNVALTTGDQTPLSTHLRAFSAAVAASLPPPPDAPVPAAALTSEQRVEAAPPAERIIYVDKQASPLKTWAWVPLAVGTAGLASGGALMFAAANRHDALLNDELTIGSAQRIRDEGKSYQTFGGIALGVGAAAVATGAAMMLLGDDEGRPAVTPIASSNGAGVVITGTLP